MGYLVLGAGAIGGTVGAGLVRDGHDVLFCDADAAHVAAMNERGLRIEGPVEQFTVPARACTPDRLDAVLPGPVDRVVLLAVKSQHTAAAARLLAGRLSAGSYVVSLQNGLTADAIAEHVGRDAVLPAFVNFGADYLEPGRILRGNRGSFRVGELDGTISERSRRFAADVPDVEVTGAILGYEWAKLAYGAMLFASALSDASIANVLGDPAYRLVLLALAGEVLGRAPVDPMPFDGFDPADLEGSLRRLEVFNRASAKSHSGVYRDLAVRHRRTEVDAQLGFLDTPLIRRLVGLVHAVEDGDRRCEPATLDLLAAHERLERLGRPLNAVADVVTAPRRAASGPLHGVPVAVKDIIDVAGVPTRFGSVVPAPPVPERDAVVVDRLRAAGADVLAVSQCLEYAAGFAHPEVGDTRNPRDPRATAGGSSGGSAALVAAGVVPMAVGTDTGGSIRIPAAYCGIVGLKPSTGLVPVDGVFPLSRSTDHVGPLGDSVTTTGALLAVLAADPSVGRRRPAATPGDPPVLGVLGGHLAEGAVTAEVRAAVEAALDRLRGAGVRLVPCPAEWTRGSAHWASVLTTVVAYEAFRVHRDRLPTLGRWYAPGTRALLDLGAGIEDAVHRDALAGAAELRAQVEESLGEVDALVGPTVPFTAPEHDPPFGTDDSPEGWFTGPFDLSGHPALTLPVPVTGLPVGLQLVGRRGADGALLDVGATVEAALAGVAA